MVNKLLRRCLLGEEACGYIFLFRLLRNRDHHAEVLGLGILV
jgi:hypothetical protein